VQEVLVELVGSRVAYKLFEFNGATKPLQRHKLIKEFQNDVNDQPCVFIVTCARAPAPNALLQTRCSKRAAPNALLPHSHRTMVFIGRRSRARTAIGWPVL
jgi:hypothetical protein